MIPICRYNFYNETTLKMSFHYEEIGTLTIQEHTVEATTANGTKADTDALLDSGTPKDAALSLTQAATLNTTAPPSYPSGRIPFPIDDRYSITYTYPTTTQIKSKHIFITILGILATAAPYNPAQQPKHQLKQVSPSKTCAIRLTPELNRVELSYANVVVGLNLLISAIMLPLEKFGEMDFSLLFLKQEIARGSVRALRPGTGVAEEEK